MSAASVNFNSVVLVTGAAGWLASVLAQELLADLKTPNLHLILADIVEPKAPAGARAVTIKADLTQKASLDQLFQTDFGVPDTIYALHGIMSRGCEDNFDLGLKVNVDSVRLLCETARQYRPAAGAPIKFIFTSSLAVYGGSLPEIVTPSTLATPESAYGMGKLVSELFINEYSRRGFIDGRIVRLPTIVVRPGAPASATSSFLSGDFISLISLSLSLLSYHYLLFRLSGIIREPLKGLDAICPIGESPDSPALGLKVWLASPETTIANLVIARHVPAAAFLPHTRVVCLPGFSATVRELLQALAHVAGPDALARVRFEDSPTDRRIVASWPSRFDNSYALSLGFIADDGGMVPIVERFKKAVEDGKA
ncbi:hypothetical protein EW145_g6958 [Phellinidium pouzarii]|uniref:NAD-dependent epimerase/dehydratase domain-containing protein n=1 Tax=Phellinidium pouzarii TaxID=167371 RepID=A0A4S4KT51_9AGAM|nr:hypothetical protein EW145_g6958 [Phellinidium pouzarii]